MKETVITATAQELAEHLFKNKDTLPTVEFSIEEDEWNYSIAVIRFADAYMVIGNFFGGGAPFCRDLMNDNDSDELAEAISKWFSDIGCGEIVYL